VARSTALALRLERGEGPEVALKRLAVAPAEGLLTEAVLKLACVVRTAARDPKLTLAVGSANPDQTRIQRGEPDELSDGEPQRRVYCTGELKVPCNSPAGSSPLLRSSSIRMA
jgi:hypothetical protein